MRQAWSLKKTFINGSPLERGRSAKKLQTIAVFVSLLACQCLLATSLQAAESRRVRKMVQPHYPELALRMKVQGTVRLEANVDADGDVTDVQVVSGHTLLKSAAVDSVKQWQYEPAGSATVIPIDVNFHLPD